MCQQKDSRKEKYWLKDMMDTLNCLGPLFKSKQMLLLPFLLLVVFQLQDLKVLVALMITLSTQILEIYQTTLHLFKISLHVSCAKTWKTKEVYNTLKQIIYREKRRKSQSLSNVCILSY